MDILTYVLDGFATTLTPTNLIYCFAGVVVGTVVGLLPGLGSSTGVALLLPLTLDLEPVTALIMLAGIYYGSQYGGTITSVLVATPGEPSTVMTAVDGYALARKGRPGPALAVAAVASFVAGTLSIVLLMILAPLLASVALKFGPPEYAALMLMAFVGVTLFSDGSRIKGYAAAAFGVAIATVGLDPQTGVARFTFGDVELSGGIGFVEVVIGLFAIAAVMQQLKHGISAPIKTRFREMLPTRNDLKRTWKPTVRGGLIGFLVGVLPGSGATLGSFLGYAVEKKLSPNKSEFGHGAIEGVAAPEAANNSATNGAFVPTLVLGIPGSGTTAVLLGAFVAFGVHPGPLLLDQQPKLVWGLLASFYVGNVILLILNLPLAPLFASILRLRYQVLYPLILFFAFIGAFAMENRVWGMWVALAAGVIGYGMSHLGFPPVPLILGLILGSDFEKALITSTSLAEGNIFYIFHRPIALTILLCIGLLALLPAGKLLTARIAGKKKTDRRQKQKEEITWRG